MTRSRGIVIGIVAALVVAAAVVIWLVSGADDDPQGTPGGGGATSEPEQVVEALELLETEPARLLPAGLEGSVDLATAVPDGSEVTADPASWTPSTAGGGLIEMRLTLPDGTAHDLIAVMAQVEGEWKVLQTIPQESRS